VVRTHFMCRPGHNRGGDLIEKNYVEARDGASGFPAIAWRLVRQRVS
jgi:hypothetical protein